MSTVDMWTYKTAQNLDLSGFKVEATDGDIGKVDESTNETGGSFIVVDTGPWIFGKKVMLPAGVIRDIDPDTETIFVQRTKDQIKDAPEYEESIGYDSSYRGRLSSYYDRGGPGWRDWD